MNDHLFGKELFILFAASAFRKLSLIYVFSYFPFGFQGRIWDLIVSVPDHCLSFLLFKSSVGHLGIPGITPVFKMASKTIASYKNDPWTNNACLNQILSIQFCFKHTYHYQNVNRVYL